MLPPNYPGCSPHSLYLDRYAFGFLSPLEAYGTRWPSILTNLLPCTGFQKIPLWLHLKQTFQIIPHSCNLDWLIQEKRLVHWPYHTNATQLIKPTHNFFPKMRQTLTGFVINTTTPRKFYKMCCKEKDESRLKFEM